MKIVSLGNDFNSYTCTQWSDFGASYLLGDDRSSAIWSDFGNGVVPRNVIIDSEGLVRYSAIGYNETEVTTLLNELLTVVAVDDSYEPESHQIIQSYPNPFNASTQIEFAVFQSGQTTLSIFNGRGQEVKTLIWGQVEAGEYVASWDGRNERRDNLPSGVYFVRLQSGSLSETQKLLMLK